MSPSILSQGQHFSPPRERAKKRPVDDTVVGEDFAVAAVFIEPTQNIFGHASVDDEPPELQLIDIGPGHRSDGDEDGNHEGDRGFDHAGRVVQCLCQDVTAPESTLSS